MGAINLLLDDCRDVLCLLLDHLPDSIHEDSEGWRWCWNELGDDAQTSVKVARRKAEALLKRVGGRR